MCSKYNLGITKKTSTRLIIFVVEVADIFWNTFFDTVLEWAPKLKQIDTHQ